MEVSLARVNKTFSMVPIAIKVWGWGGLQISLCSRDRSRSPASRDSMFSVGIRLSDRERSIFSKGDKTGEEGNSGGVTASCSLDEADVDRSRK